MKAAILICIALGVLCMAQASWIHAKAWLAQRLIAQAWERARDGQPRGKPWPWADTWPVARLSFLDQAGSSLTVLAGASGRTLAFGPGHDPASALPGEQGNSVIAGHRDTHFALLRDTEPGDRLVIERPDGSVVAYWVSDVRVVDARDTRIALDRAARRLTLVTCYPFDAVDASGPLRFVVTADDAPGATSFTWQTARAR